MQFHVGMPVMTRNCSSTLHDPYAYHSTVMLYFATQKVVTNNIIHNCVSSSFLCRALADRTIFITGASRGIGKAIAIKAARDGANIVIAAKTAEPHPKLPGTIYTAAKEGIELCISCY